MPTTEAFKKLLADGGFTRFYRGLGPALIQAPLSRFGDTAANAGALALFGSLESTKNLPVAVQTVGASMTAAAFRILLVPVDTVKTIMQVEGKGGISTLMAKVKKTGPTAFFHGALATSAATFVGHYPWFAVYNTLQEWIPKRTDTAGKLGRNAAIGFCATLCSVSLLTQGLRKERTYNVDALFSPVSPNLAGHYF
jgi:Mitochondrial carrier protein